jgi:hypothetical protein
MSEPIQDPALTALETALAALVPLGGDSLRDRMLFRAGQASMRRRPVWPCATAALALLSATLGAMLLLRPAPRTVERVYVQVPVPVPAPAVPAAVAAPPRVEPSPAESVAGDVAPPDDSYLQLRRQVVENGADALPPATAWSAPPRPVSLESLLGLPPEALAAPLLLRAKAALSSGGAS